MPYICISGDFIWKIRVLSKILQAWLYKFKKKNPQGYADLDNRLFKQKLNMTLLKEKPCWIRLYASIFNFNCLSQNTGSLFICVVGILVTRYVIQIEKWNRGGGPKWIIRLKMARACSKMY